MIQKFPIMCVIYGQIFAIGLYVGALKVCVFVYHLFVIFSHELLDMGSGLLTTYR